MDNVIPANQPQEPQFKQVGKELAKEKEVAQPKMRFVIREGLLMEMKQEDLTIGEKFQAVFGSGGARLQTVMQEISNNQALSKQLSLRQLEQLAKVVKKYNKTAPPEKKINDVVIQTLIEKRQQQHNKLTQEFNRLKNDCLFLRMYDIAPQDAKLAQQNHAQQIRGRIEGRITSLFDKLSNSPDEELILQLQQNQIISKTKGSIFKHICSTQLKGDFSLWKDSPFFRVLQKGCDLPGEYGVSVDDVPSEIRNHLPAETAAMLTKYSHLRKQCGIEISNEKCFAMAKILHKHFPPNVNLENVDFANCLEEAQEADLPLDIALDYLTNEFKIEGEKNPKIKNFVTTYESLALAGEKNGRLTRPEAFENALIIHFTVPRIFKNIIKSTTAGTITLDKQNENARRIFWKARDVKNITNIEDVDIYISTQHEIGQGGIKMVTTGIKVNALGDHIYQAEDLLAYQETMESSQTPTDVANLRANKELIESIEPDPTIVRTRFVTVFSTTKGEKTGAFSELCQTSLDKLPTTNFLNQQKTPPTPENCKKILSSLVILFDGYRGLSRLHKQRIAHGDFKDGNIFIAEDPSGLKRGKVADFDFSVPYQKIVRELQNFKNSDPVYKSSTPDKQKKLEEYKRRDLEKAYTIVGQHRHATPAYTSYDVHGSPYVPEEQNMKADCWAAGVTLYATLSGGQIPPFDTNIIKHKQVLEDFITENNAKINDLKKAKQPINNALMKSLQLLGNLLKLDYKLRLNAEAACTELAHIIKDTLEEAKQMKDKLGKPLDLSEFETVKNDIDAFLKEVEPEKPKQKVAQPNKPKAPAQAKTNQQVRLRNKVK